MKRKKDHGGEGGSGVERGSVIQQGDKLKGGEGTGEWGQKGVFGRRARTVGRRKLGCGCNEGGGGRKWSPEKV